VHVANGLKKHAPFLMTLMLDNGHFLKAKG